MKLHKVRAGKANSLPRMISNFEDSSNAKYWFIVLIIKPKKKAIEVAMMRDPKNLMKLFLAAIRLEIPWPEKLDSGCKMSDCFFCDD